MDMPHGSHVVDFTYTSKTKGDTFPTDKLKLDDQTIRFCCLLVFLSQTSSF